MLSIVSFSIDSCRWIGYFKVYLRIDSCRWIGYFKVYLRTNLLYRGERYSSSFEAILPDSFVLLFETDPLEIENDPILASAMVGIRLGEPLP